MTEMVPSGLMRGRWRRSDGPLEGDTRPKWGETAGPRTPWTPPRQCPTPHVILCRGNPQPWFQRMERIVHGLGVSLNTEKTRIVDAADGFDFLGMRFRLKPMRR